MFLKVVTELKHNGVLSDAEKKAQNDLYQQHKDSIRVPRRPYWDARTTPEELAANERESFLAWRRDLAELQETDGEPPTPSPRGPTP